MSMANFGLLDGSVHANVYDRFVSPNDEEDEEEEEEDEEDEEEEEAER